MAVACGSEARAPRERGWRSRAGRRPAHPGSADGGRVRVGGLRTQGARMAVACGPEARAPRERGWRSRAGRRLAHPGSADGGRVRAGGWRTQGARMAVACGSEARAPGVARMAVACGPEACAPRERGWRSRAGRRPAHPGSADGGRVRVGGWRSWGTGAFFRDNSARQSLKTRGSLHDLGVRSTSSLCQWHKNVISRYYLYR
jgi:hypothetical protein